MGSEEPQVSVEFARIREAFLRRDSEGVLAACRDYYHSIGMKFKEQDRVNDIDFNAILELLMAPEFRQCPSAGQLMIVLEDLFPFLVLSQRESLFNVLARVYGEYEDEALVMWALELMVNSGFHSRLLEYAESWSGSPTIATRSLLPYGLYVLVRESADPDIETSAVQIIERLRHDQEPEVVAEAESHYQLARPLCSAEAKKRLDKETQGDGNEWH